jgi:hypothetical protein
MTAAKPMQAADPAVCQATALPTLGDQFASLAEQAVKGEAVAPQLSGGPAGRGDRGTRSQGSGAADSGGALSCGEDSGGI